MNTLTPAETERLALAIEECSEVIKVATKILRFGFEGFHPDNPEVSNRQLLAIEMEDAAIALGFLAHKDLPPTPTRTEREVIAKVQPWLRHNDLNELLGVIS